MSSRRLGGLNLPLVLVAGALIYLLFADVDLNFFQSRVTSLPAPSPYIAPQTASCRKCPDPIICPPPAPIVDPGENVFCKSTASRCNHVGLPDNTLCKLLSDVITRNSTEDVCSTTDTRGGSSIPHIIHQSWKQSEGLPLNFATWSQSWKDLHPDWKYKFWSDQDNDDFIAAHYGWIKDTYSKLPATINRADLVRYFYMYKEGGVYADMDTWLIRKLDTLTTGFTDCVGQKAIVAMLSDDISFYHNIPNAWMASSPGHPFWIFLVRVIQERFTEVLMKEAQGDKDADDIGVESLTGPIVLKEAYDTWQCMFGEMANIEAVEAGKVFVSNWNDEESAKYFSKVCAADHITSEEQQKRCLKSFPNAHVLTFWTHTWHDPWFDKHGDDDKLVEEPQQHEEVERKLGDDKDYAYEDEGDYH